MLDEKYASTKAKQEVTPPANIRAWKPNRFVKSEHINAAKYCAEVCTDGTNATELMSELNSVAISLSISPKLISIPQTITLPTDQPAKDVLHEDRYWKRFVPHEKSGPCETYDPPSESDPGYEISMYCFFYKDVAFLCLQHCVVKSIDNK